MIYKIINSKLNSYAYTLLKYKVATPEGFLIFVNFLTKGKNIKGTLKLLSITKLHSI